MLVILVELVVSYSCYWVMINYNLMFWSFFGSGVCIFEVKVFLVNIDCFVIIVVNYIF